MRRATAPQSRFERFLRRAVGAPGSAEKTAPERQAQTPLAKSVLRIVSGGTAATTQVLLDGKPLPDVASVRIHRIVPFGLVGATIEFCVVHLDVTAEVDVIKTDPLRPREVPPDASST
jgi:hypothetical protein